MRIRALLAIAGMATLVAATPAGAATLTVTTTSDGAGSCSGTSCTTLRAAVTQANLDTTADTIRLGAATYGVNTQLAPATPMTIVGTNAASTTVRSAGKERVFDVATGGQLTLQHLTVSNGIAPDIGGDIRVGSGTQLSLDHVEVTGGTVSGVTPQGGAGIGIQGAATVQITKSLIDANSAISSPGGGILAAGDAKAAAGIKLAIADSTIFNNSASTRAGIAAANDTRNTTSLVRSTVASNSAGSTDGGPGIDVNDAETFTVTASIIAGNTGDGVQSNCGGVLTSGGANVDSGSTCKLAGTNDLQNTDPQLGTLTPGLGETPVLPISALSPAVDLDPVGDKSCAGADQRDLRRPQGTGCDAGAYEVDQPPDTTITSGPSGLTNSSSASFGFRSGEPGVTFQCELDGPGTATGTFSACTSPHAYTKLADGSYTFLARAVDGTGHVDDTPASRSFTVDTTPPGVSITGGPAGPTNNASPSFSFTLTERTATADCKLDGPGATTGTFAPCTSPWSYGPLADGAYTFTVRATDVAGNSATATRSFTVDTVPPSVTITGGPSGPTNTTSPSFTFTSDPGVSFQCKLDGPGTTTGAFVACASPKAYNGLADGAYVLTVRATDPAGNIGSTTRSFTVDTVAPAVSITGGPTGQTNNRSPSFTFTAEPGATVQCRLDGAAFAACTAPKAYSNLADGSHTFDVRASDAAGNVGSATRSFTVDTVPPEVTITSGPSGPTNSASPSFGWVVDPGATTQCRIDAAAFASCTSPKAYSGIADGDHTFQVRASDAAGNSSTASRSFTVDTGSPTSTITSGPSGSTNDRSPAFGFTASDASATFACRLDGPGGTTGSFAACAPPKAYGNLPDGAYTFRVRASDGSGNTGPEAVRSFTLDTAPPPATVTGGPSGSTTDSSPSFDFGSPDGAATFECRLDGPGAAVGTYGPCASPRSFSALAPGAYTFRLLARDGAGNTTETTRSFTVLLPKPKQTVVVEPVSGQTLIKKPGSKRFVPLDATEGIPLGSIVDTRHGRIRLEAIRRAGQRVETALFYGGIFKVTQTAAVTQLRLVERLSCPAPGHASAARKRRSRRLWGDGHGQFRTRGQYSSATVRGTKWLVQDSCGSTLTKVARGIVAVRDLVKKKTVKVPAGHRYVARRR